MGAQRWQHMISGDCDRRHHQPSTLTIVKIRRCRSARVLGCSHFYVRTHGTRTARDNLGRSVVNRSGAAVCCSGCSRLAFPRWAGRGRHGRGHRRSLGVCVPFGDRDDGGRAVVAGPDPGSGRRGHSGDSRGVAGMDVVDRHPPLGHTRGCRNRVDRRRHHGCLCNQRSGEAGGGPGAALPCAARGDRRDCRMPRRGGLVVPEQSRHLGRRTGFRPGHVEAAPRCGHAAAGRGGGAVACPGRGALPARCAGWGDSRQRSGGGGVARVHAPCSACGVTVGEALAEERFRPREPRPQRQLGCRRPAVPGWNSRGL